MASSASGQASNEARSYGRRASLLSIGVGITGLITYLYFAIASHELSREDYGQIAVLWSAVFIVVSVLQRPVEQLLSRTVSENLATGQPIAHTVRVAATIQLSIAVVFDAIAIALRGPIEDGLLDGNDTLYWIGVAAITAYGASYFARGFLAGSHRLTLYALLIICESVSRTAFPLAVAVGIATGQDAVALGIVAAPTLSLIVVPFAFLRRGVAARAEQVAPESAGAPEAEFTLAHGGGFAAAVFLIMLSEQTFLNAGPLLVKASAGAAAAGFIFNILMIARAPLQLFQAVSTSLLPHLTRLASRRSSAWRC
jgi:O-antigen/teichoic acid export membrane protein